MNDTESIDVLMKKIEDLSLKIESLMDEVSFGQKQIFNHNEAARYIGVSPSYLYVLSSKNVISYHKSKGGANFYKREDLDEYMLGGEYVKSIDLIEETAKSIINAIDKRKRLTNSLTK